MQRLLHRLVLVISVIALLPVQTAGAAVYVNSSSFSDSGGVVAGWNGDKTGFVSSSSDGGATFSAWMPDGMFMPNGAVRSGSDVYAFEDWTDYIRHSSDGGDNWSAGAPVMRQTARTRIHAMATFAGGRVAMAGYLNKDNIGQPAFIMTSSDRGSTWTTGTYGPFYQPATPDDTRPLPLSTILGMDVDPSGTAGWAVGTEGKLTGDFLDTAVYVGPLIRRTIDSGATWSAQTAVVSPVLTAGLSEVAAASTTNVFATDTGKSFIRSSNGGATWTRYDLPLDLTRPVAAQYMSARAIDARPPAKVVVAGTAGKIGWTGDALAATPVWKYYNIPSAVALNGVSMLSDTNWIVVGDNETVARTTNAGVSWTVDAYKPPSVSVIGPPQGFAPGSVPVTVRGTASDIGFGVAKVGVRVRRADGQNFNGISWVPEEFWLPATTTDHWKTWSYTMPADPLLQQMVTVTAKATDVVGLAVISNPISSGLPIIASISLADGASVTANTDVTTQISAAGSTHMRWRVGSGAWSQVLPYATSAAVTLTAGEGVKSVEFEFSNDNFTTVAARATDTIVLHASLPVVAMSTPVSGFSIAGTPVAISGTASDTGAVADVAVRIRRADGKHWNGSSWQAAEFWLPTSSSDGFANWQLNWTPVGVMSAVTLSAKATDTFGFQAESGYITSAAQEGASVVIEGGAGVTRSAAVNVSVHAPGATHMRWSGSITESQTAFVPVRESVPVTLTSGDGTKTVDFEFSVDGSTTETTATDSIVLHTSVPTVTIAAPAGGFTLTPLSEQISGTAADEGSAVSSVEVLVRRSDGRSWTGADWATEDRWLPASSSDSFANWQYTWTPDAQTLDSNMIVTVMAAAIDGTGVRSSIVTLTSGLPIRAQVSLAQGATYTRDLEVPVSIASAGASHVRWSVNGGPPSAWVPVSSHATVTIGAGEGTKTVDFQFSADGSRVALDLYDSIFLDQSGPAVTLATPAALFSYRVPAVTISGTATDTASGATSVQLSLQQGTGYWNESGWGSSVNWIDVPIVDGSWSYQWVPDSTCQASGKPVTVTVRSTDSVGNSGTSVSRTSANPLDETTVTLLNTDSVVAYGVTTYIRGAVTSEGDPARYTAVRLYEKAYNSSTYKLVESKYAYWNGSFVFAVKPTVRTVYKVVTPGTYARLSGTSAPLTLYPKAYLLSPSCATPVSHTSSYRWFGFIRPKHVAGTYPVRIYRERYMGGGVWRSYGYVAAKASDFYSLTRYRAWVRLPYAGTWRLRAYHYDAAHAVTYSSYTTVKVY